MIKDGAAGSERTAGSEKPRFEREAGNNASALALAKPKRLRFGVARRRE